jgi:hypothetical protein
MPWGCSEVLEEVGVVVRAAGAALLRQAARTLAGASGDEPGGRTDDGKSRMRSSQAILGRLRAAPSWVWMASTAQ